MKNWRDLLYFTKGERQALILVLLLMVAGSVWFVIRDTGSSRVLAEIPPRYIVHPGNAPVPVPILIPAQTDTVERPSRRQPQPAPFTRTEKFPAGTLVELNTADTTTLKKVPGIGSAFAGRIVKYRVLLGGFYSVEQLREVYGIDEERYLALQNWFYADTSFIAKLPVNLLPSDSLAKHPYITYRQARVLWQQRRRDGRLNSWENLRLLEEFTETDRERLSAYLSFQ